MRKENLASSVVAQHRKFSEEISEYAQFFDERFEIFAPNANSCIISGSSIGYPNIEYTEAHLDAAATSFITDNTGVITEIRMATADGLGDSRTDVIQNNATRKAAQVATAVFCTLPNTSTIRQRFLNISEKVNQETRSGQIQGDAALAGTIVQLSEQAISCQFANVGDTMIIVLDRANLSVKYIVPPHITSQGSNIWAPLSLRQFQRWVVKGLSTECAQFQTADVIINPGDFIIQMTDGAWSELKKKRIEHAAGNEKWIEYSIDKDYFAQIIADKSPLTDAPMPMQIADSLIRKILKQTLAQRLHFNNLFSKIKDNLNVQDKFITIKEWLDTFADKTNAIELESYLFDTEHDGICFTPEAPAYMAAEWLKEFCFGDCTTISVTQVPDRKRELIRALVDNPKNSSTLLPMIAECLQGQNITPLFNQLRAEKCLGPIGAKLSTLEIVNVHPKNDLDVAENLVAAYLKIQVFLQDLQLTEIAQLYASQSPEVVTYLHEPVHSLLHQYQSLTFSNRFLNARRYCDIKNLDSRLNTIYKSQMQVQEFGLTV